MKSKLNETKSSEKKDLSKDAMGLVFLAFVTLISFTRSCENTTKAIKSIETAEVSYMKNIEKNK